LTRFWAEHAWLGGDRAESGVLIEVRGDEIAAVAPGAERGGATILRGLTLPGLANAHSHAFHRALRGRTHRGGGTFWTWREDMYAVAERLDPDSYRALARAVFAEMALAGVTCVGEFHYVHHGPDGTPYAEPNAMGRAVIAAAAEAGIRITLLDACYLAGGFGTPVEGAQVRFSDGDAETWAERASTLRPAPHARVGAAIHSVRAVPADAIATVAGWAGERDAPLHAHLSEQRAENEACLAAHGRSPAELLDEHGALGAHACAVHATHLTDADIARLAGTRTAICMCATTERDLADGIGPARALSQAGAPLCTGSDSHAVIDPFEEARAIELDERLRSERRGHFTAAELLRAATEGGHAALGWSEAGRIEPGAPADLVTVGLDSVRLAGAEPHALLESVLFTAAPADVREVLVGGRRVVADGRHATIDVAAELRSAIAAVVPEGAAPAGGSPAARAPRTAGRGAVARGTVGA
jgi:formiminoglutamate deiminase